MKNKIESDQDRSASSWFLDARILLVAVVVGLLIGVCGFGLDRLAALANSGYVSGRYVVDGMTLYVNNGTGLWPGFALRLGRPSELTRITLRQAM